MAFNFYPNMASMPAASETYRASEPAWSASSNHSAGDVGDSLESEGRCSGCGVRTHRLRRRAAEMSTSRGESSPAIMVHKEPLTAEGVVHRGRCLRCDPPTAAGHGEAIRVQCPQATSNAPHPQHVRAILPEAGADQRLGSEEGEDEEDEIIEILCRMGLHPHDLRVQISCFHSLWVLSWETDNARAIGCLGGVTIILGNLRSHLRTHIGVSSRYNRNNNTSSPSYRQQVQLQSNGLSTLQNLSADGRNTEQLVKHGLVPFVLLSMSTFLHDEEIVYPGCNTLANIILSNGETCKSAILNDGGLNVLARSVEVHRNNTAVSYAARKCCLLLGQENFKPRVEIICSSGMEKCGVVTDGDASTAGATLIPDMNTSSHSWQSSFSAD